MEGGETDVAEGKQGTGQAVTGRANSTLGETARSLWSVAICAHLFAVAVALSANLNRSPLQDRILNAKGLRTYLQLLHWDSSDLIGYQLTHAMEAEDNHRLVVEPIAGANGSGDPGLVYPGEDQWPGGFRAQRARNLLGRLAAFTQQDEGEALSEVFGAILGTLRGNTPGGSAGSPASGDVPPVVRMRVVRLERLAPLPLDANQDEAQEEANEERQEVFVGDAWRDVAGSVRVNRRVDRTDAALVSPQYTNQGMGNPAAGSSEAVRPQAPSTSGEAVRPEAAGP